MLFFDICSILVQVIYIAWRSPAYKSFLSCVAVNVVLRSYRTSARLDLVKFLFVLSIDRNARGTMISAVPDSYRDFSVHRRLLRVPNNTGCMMASA